MNFSFAVAGATDFYFYRCRRELYVASRPSDPFPFCEEYIGRLPFSQVKQVYAQPLAQDQVTKSRRRGFWKDVAYNQTVGNLLNVSDKTVSMAALVVLDVGEVGRTVVFGVPHGEDLPDGEGFIGDLMPDALATALELGGLVRDYLRCDQPDARAVVNAEGVATGLLAMMGRLPSESRSVARLPLEALASLTRATASTLK